MNEKYRKAFKEVLHYLKGIHPADVAKIPSEMIELFRHNADPEYICDFDYTLPLCDLKLMDETRGMIAMLCLHYWCKTDKEKQKFSEHLKRNEVKYKLEQYKKML